MMISAVASFLRVDNQSQAQRRLAAILAGVAICALGSGPSRAMLPFFAGDAHTKIVNWTPIPPVPNEPELVELIQQHATVYLENGHNDGDTSYFVDYAPLVQNPSATMRYVGFGGWYWGGSSPWMDPQRRVMTQEENFYHSTNPAGLSAWRILDGTTEKVVLHWLPDMRYVTQNEYASLNNLAGISNASRVERYVIRRFHPGGSFEDLDPGLFDWDTLSLADPNAFKFTDPSPGDATSYAIFSIPPSPLPSTPVAYSIWPVSVAPIAGPHFWSTRVDFQERRIAIDDGSFNWPIRFYVDQVVDPALVRVDRVTAFWGGTSAYTSLPVAMPTGPFPQVAPGVWEIACEWPTQLPNPSPSVYSDMRKYGGVAYCLVYTPVTGDPIRCPPNGGPNGSTQFCWSSINNRTVGKDWLNFMMNCQDSSWPAVVTEICNHLGSGQAVPPGGGSSVDYKRILLDSVMGIISPTHNVIKPTEFTNTASCRAATVAGVQGICQAVYAANGSDLDVVCNVSDLAFIDAFAPGGIVQPGFGGVMDENFTDDGNGELRLANMLWKFRGHPYLHNIIKTDGKFHVDLFDRIQTVVGYLLTRNPEIPAGQEPRETMGFVEWREPPAGSETDLPIFPEQFVNAKMWQGGDPFAQTIWPPYDDGTADDWSSKITSDLEAVNWLKNPANATGFMHTAGGRDFATGIWELDDGLPYVTNLVAVSWDATSGSGTTTLAELFSDHSTTTWYKLVGDTLAVLDGGIVSSIPITSTSALPTEQGEVGIYFTADVHSPVVAGAAVDPIPAGSGRSSELKIAASHWNGQPLQLLRVAGADMGWGDSVELHDSNHDGIYTCSVTNGPGATPGVHTLRALAIGNDGLRTYTYVDVEAVTVPDIAIQATAPYPLLAQSYDGKVVLAVNVTSYVPLNPASPVEVTAPTIFGNSTPVVLWDDGQAGLRAGAEDAVAGDGIFTSDRIQGVVNAAGTFYADVVAHPVTGDPVSGAVSVTSVLSRAEFVDKTASSGDIAMNDGVPRYAMAYANTSTDRVSGKKIMIVTFADGITPPLILENQSLDGSAADFADRSGNWLGDGITHLPEGSRGVCFGDFGGGAFGGADGKEDFFLCGATGSHLYVNDGTSDVPQFVDVVETAFSAEDQARIAGATSAAWSDYDLDGDLDLFVATSNYSGPMSEIASQVGVTFGGAFFTNNGNSTFQFREVPMLTSSGTALAGTWAQLIPGRRWPYLIMPWISSEGSLLAYCLDGGFAARIFSVTGGQLSNLNSIVVCDYNHDNRPDLLVTDHGGGGKAAILRNVYDPATAVTSFEVACTFGAGRIWNGATVADFDGNGQDDILLLPESGAPALYMAQSYSTTPTFTEDLAFTLGLRAGATSGCIATDQGGSRLPDISLGRAGERVVYQNLRAVSGPHPGRWVEISLGSVGNSNSSLIGAEVTIQQAGKSWTKTVDGGSGRGGQDANSFRFFLEEDASNVAVSVSYPSGDSDFLASVPVDSVYAVVEDTPVTLKTGTKTNPDPTFTYELGPGTMDWVFRWRTVGIKGDQRQDAVTIENYLGYTDTSPCYMGIEPGTPLVLHWGDPGVTFNISWDGTDWVHEARWAGLPCESGCQYRFKVTSGLGNGVTTTSSQAKVIPALEFCMPDPDPNQQ